MTHQPSWLTSLLPIAPVTLRPLRPASALQVWHVSVALRAWEVPTGAALSGIDTWNGKALVVGDDSGLDRSVGEVEIAARLRRDGASAGWTGRPRDPWSRWAVDAHTRAGWFAEVDLTVRSTDELLASNTRGRPDVIQWRVGRDDFCCVEYKGPSPTQPNRSDTVKEEQEAWLMAACHIGLLSADRIALVEWRPTVKQAAVLRAQALASKRGRLKRSQRTPPAL